jgi:hypothetical protein
VRGGHAAKNRLAEGTYEGVLVARVGVRDKVGPQCVTERSTHMLGDAPDQPAPALLCALARHLGQFDRVGGLVGTQAMSLHPRAAVVPSQLGRESGLGGVSEGASSLSSF